MVRIGIGDRMLVEGLVRLVILFTVGRRSFSTCQGFYPIAEPYYET
jgi:hypothetical protein